MSNINCEQSKATPETANAATSSQTPTHFRFLNLPPELRDLTYDFAVMVPLGGEVSFHQPCAHRHGLRLVSKQVHDESKPAIEAVGGSVCHHTVFRIFLPTFEEMPRSQHRMKLLQGIQDRDSSANSSRGQEHDFAQAQILIFKTGHLGEDAPSTVAVFLQLEQDFPSVDIQGGTAARKWVIGEELHDVLPLVRRALLYNVPVIINPTQANAPLQTADEIHRDAITYLAERVRIAACEEIEELDEEPAFCGL
ncbi:hypothetical protein PRZ48_012065 [Zasmidium cellare]|uniref:Uncharacterized protein n=1 Tax=Zasmidium cellare TaxID=395010 RepID=A0ABR0E4C3_ZASCE|nr:hypothetical protein PRZ48_012065 [Zasmidium cellare]